MNIITILLQHEAVVVKDIAVRGSVPVALALVSKKALELAKQIMIFIHFYFSAISNMKLYFYQFPDLQPEVRGLLFSNPNEPFLKYVKEIRLKKYGSPKKKEFAAYTTVRVFRRISMQYYVMVLTDYPYDYTTEITENDVCNVTKELNISESPSIFYQTSYRPNRQTYNNEMRNCLCIGPFYPHRNWKVEDDLVFISRLYRYAFQHALETECKEQFLKRAKKLRK